MSSLNNALLAVTFLVVAGSATLLMFYLWGFPYDHKKNRSDAPHSLIVVHRLLGYVFVAIYVYLMIQMVPRMWTYQIELPARTVIHLAIGFTIGAILVAKIVVVRFFKHMEAKLAPLLGTALFVCTVVLMGLALPFVFREYLLRSQAMSGETFSGESLQRVREHLPKAGLSDSVFLNELASPEGLMAGREVLMGRCTQCHDLRTVLARPRTPAVWRETVRRMANRSTVLQAIDEREQWQVTAYLVAISPTLQQTLRQRRSLELDAAQSQSAVLKAVKMVDDAQYAKTTPYEPRAAKVLFESRCAQCHKLAQVDKSPPRTIDEVSALVTRMVQNGLAAEENELAQIIWYLRTTYVHDPLRTAATSQPDTIVSDLDTIVMRPAGDELRFEQTEISVRAGTTVTLMLENISTQMPHNVTILRSDSDVDAVTAAALHAADLGYVPEHPAIVASTGSADPGARKQVTFTVPSAGEYPYLCLIPGHSLTMRGTLRVRDPGPGAR